MLVIKSFSFNMFSENTFVVWDEGSKESIIVDPGCSTPEEESRLEEYIFGNQLHIKYLLLTHCHIDHILGCDFIIEKYKPEYYASKEDLFLIKQAVALAAGFGFQIKPIPEPENFLSEDLQLKIGTSILTFLFTPGHTPGEYCIYFKKEAICLTGDVLFKNSIGRTDLWGGNYNTLITSIKTKLFALPDNVKIYPGHGESSEIGTEKNFNPFLHESSKK